MLISDVPRRERNDGLKLSRWLVLTVTWTCTLSSNARYAILIANFVVSTDSLSIETRTKHCSLEYLFYESSCNISLQPLCSIWLAFTPSEDS